MRRIHLVSMTALLLASAMSGHAEQPMFDSPALNDDELAEARGGFDLPDGARLDFSVTIRTSVDGVPVLQTALQMIGNDITKRVEAMQADIANPNTAPEGSQGGNTTGAGSINVDLGDRSVTATANLPDLFVQHSIGRQISSLVVNTADGRTVENHLALDLRLENVQPLSLGSVGFRVQSLGVDAALWRAGG